MERHLWQKDKYINVDQNVNIRTRPSLLGSRLQINQCCKYNINICHELGGIYKLWTPNYSRYDQRQKYMLWARVVNPAGLFLARMPNERQFPAIIPAKFSLFTVRTWPTAVAPRLFLQRRQVRSHPSMN